MPDIAAYLDFVLTLFFAFGMAFEIPIAAILLVWTGTVTPEDLTKKRPYVIVGAFVIGMFLTPPDIISQTLLAIPMWVLFEAGVFFSRFFVRSEEERERAENAAEETQGGDAGKAASTAAAGVDYPDDYVEPSDAEMEAELDRIEAQEQLEQSTAETATKDVEEDDDNDDDQEFDDDDEDAVAIIEDAVDSKLQRIMTLRDEEDLDAARKLLYEVLVEGNEEQVGVARNILEQLDS